MKPFARAFPVLLSLLFFSRCASHPSDPGALPEDYTIIPMDQYKIEPSDIKAGSTVSILAFSGGKSSKDKKLYYAQFIVVDRGTGDTTRILSAMIAIDSIPGSKEEYFSPVNEFDGQKGVLEATYEVPSSNQAEIQSIMAVLPGDNPDPQKMTASLDDTAGTKEYVLVNRNAAIFLGKYKTAKGILRFHQQPW